MSPRIVQCPQGAESPLVENHWDSEGGATVDSVIREDFSDKKEFEQSSG